MAVYLGENEVGFNTTYGGTVPSGTSTITENGIYDVTNFASASVNVVDPFKEIAVDLIYYNEIYAEGSYRTSGPPNNWKHPYSYTSEDVSNWCDTFANIHNRAFAGKNFYGSFIFNNATYIDQQAFAIPAYNVTQGGGSAYYYFPSCSWIGAGAFGGNQGIIHADFPICTEIHNSTFYNCFSLTSVSFPICSSIAYSAFVSCIGLTSVYFPECSGIGNNAFLSCQSLTSVDFPKCKSIASSAFYNCSALTLVSFPLCEFIGAYAFKSCRSLTEVNFPSCITISTAAFSTCSALTTASFPNVNYIGSSAFYSCSALTTADFPSATSIGSYAFGYCTSLTTVSFPRATSIAYSAFIYCYNLLSFYLLGSSVPTLGTNAFYSTPIGGNTTSTGGVYGSIFVPSSLYDQYIVATNWSSFSSRIVSV